MDLPVDITRCESTATIEEVLYNMGICVRPQDQSRPNAVTKTPLARTHPECKTVGDLVRVLAKQRRNDGLTPVWYRDDMELRFERPKPWWKRAVLAVHEHAEFLVPDSLHTAADSDD